MIIISKPYLNITFFCLFEISKDATANNKTCLLVVCAVMCSDDRYFPAGAVIRLHHQVFLCE